MYCDLSKTISYFVFLVKELLEEKIDPNDANEDGLTTLHQV